MNCKHACRKWIAQCRVGEVFTQEQVAHAIHTKGGNVLDKALSDLREDGSIRSIARGVYYKCGFITYLNKAASPNSTTGIRSLWLVDANGKRIGYESGPSLACNVGLQTAVPAETHVYTNLHKNYRALAKRWRVRLHIPKTIVTDNNWRELQILDLLRDCHAYDTSNVEEQLARAITISGADRVLMMNLARDFYSVRVQRLASIALKAI